MKDSPHKIRTKAPSAARVREGKLTEDQLGECIRDACKQLGWHFLWLRKTYNSSDGVLDLMLISLTHTMERDLNGNRSIIERELKGHDARGRLGTLTPAQMETIEAINNAGGNAALWEPADWFSGKILDELR